MDTAGPHHHFQPASGGEAVCIDCGRRYDTSTAWRADVDPCADDLPTGMSEEQALWKYRMFLASAGFPVTDR
jgi:hypothetical protein